VVDVQLTEAAWKRRRRRHLEVAYSSCGLCAKEAISEISRMAAPIKSTLAITASSLLDLMGRMYRQQTIFQATVKKFCRKISGFVL
jgi:formate dehydrogenase assembly factor FdhD